MNTILIVEDDKLLLKMYQREFENSGFRVKTAFNGMEGLKLALEEKPDVILLDVKMPIKDGLSMLEELRMDEWGRSAKVIIASGVDPDGQTLGRVINAHPSYYLIKGEKRPEDVVQIVRDVLGE